MLTVEQEFRQFCRLLVADRLFGDELTAYFERDAAEAGGAGKVRRVELFRKFLEEWSRNYYASEAPAPFTTASMMYSAGPPPPKTAVALLLNDVLHFNQQEIAEIIAPTENSVTELIVTGRVIHASAAEGSAIIIEDEALIAADLSQIIQSLGVNVRGVAHDARMAAKLIESKKPDIILADFNLEDEKTGADVVNECRAFHDCPVIFVTGFPEQALKGSEREPDVVIGKPYTIESIKAAVAHCLSNERLRVADDER